ncbi:hypothetical protein RchiOBHm_Chr1g0340551 [Rosa chinensis]|uniref:Uncharacterized protein n=1 Tax=Rosa chinensis TaxID=74649 RepID=A0A2P6SDH6_ROSCH|nr:hypothetical protein RchiOBHm_Chr1g0340551 [Rosa chinensis]
MYQYLDFILPLITERITVAAFRSPSNHRTHQSLHLGALKTSFLHLRSPRWSHRIRLSLPP